MKRIAAALLTLCLCSAASGFDLQGHRGARALAPENTLESFARALSIGVTTLELDIAITRDGVPVVSHDPALNPDITRAADGRFLEARGPLISSLSFDELQRYDVGRLKPGSRYAGLYPEQKPADGARIPRLADLFALVRKSGNATVRFAIETKVTPTAPGETLAPEPFARAVVAAIRDAGLAGRSSIQSFDWRTLAEVQKIAPEIPTVYLTIQRTMDNVMAGSAQGSPWTAGVQFKDHGSVPKMIKAAGGRIWSCFHGDLDAAKIKEAHSLGLQVLAWTVNDAATAGRLIDMGVDGIVTDRPDLVREEMRKRGLSLPPARPVRP